MDFNKLFNKLKELGHAHNKREELREYCRLKFDQIIKFLPRRILNSDGSDILDCILNGLPDNQTICMNKVKVIDAVLQIMRKESTSLTHCGDVISRVCLELSRSPIPDLVRWCNDSIQSIVDNSDVNMIWRDVLPECLNAISTHDVVQHCGSELSSIEYKEQCLHTLCQCRWSERQLVQLAAMFKDMQLSRNEHRQAVNKISSYIIDLPPETLPPLVHQLLKLCKTYDLEIVLSHLSHYFSIRLYSKLEPPPQDSESTTMDIDDIVPHSPAELSRCLSTCLYHISAGAAEPELVRRHVKCWPRTQLLRAPFIIDLALAMSDKGAEFRSACLDVIKSAIEQRALDDLRASESAWVRSVLPPDVDVASLLKVITTESANHRQLTVVGLINLAFSLLSVSRVKPVAPTCWSHGKLILVRLSKSQPETAAHILSQLADRLCGDSQQRQYADCLYVLCKLTPVSVERCTQLTTILENCQPSPTDYRAAARVLEAIHPLIGFSTRSRDALVMVCRKGLYSRESMYRCLALCGFLTVLRHVRLSRSISSSQSASTEHYSAHSYLTQLTVDLHATQQGNAVTSRVRNEAMCMEVVSILRRCLVQDALVKQLLFTKLYDCAKDKPALHESILELLYEHLSKYLPETRDASAPLLFDKCIQINGVTAVLQEPIACLIYAVAQFLQPTEEEDLEDILASQSAEPSGAYLKSKLTNIMEQLCAGDNLGQIELEDHGLTDLTPESKAKCLKVQQTLQCCEALIAHLVMQWNSHSSDVASQVYKLFKACNGLLEQTKAPAKLSKKNNKTLNETKETLKSQKSQKSQKEKGKAPNKLSNLVKERAGPFKPLPCIWDLKFCVRIVELLYSEEITWSSLEQRNHIRGRRDFHQWALRCVLSALASEHLEKKAVALYVVKIATVMYNRCLCRFQDMCSFDDQTALGCLEVFKACLNVLYSPNYSLKKDIFLSSIIGSSDTSAPMCTAMILEDIHTALAHIEEESVAEERDQLVKKQVSVLVQTAGLLLETPVSSSPGITSVIVKLEDYVRTSKQDWQPLLGPLLTAACRELQEAQLIDELLVKLASELGNIDEEEPSADGDSSNFPTIDSRSGHAVLITICTHLAARAKTIEHLLSRAKDLAVALPTAAHATKHRIEKEITEVYKSVVVQLCQLCSWTSRSAKLRCAVGGASDRVLAAAHRLYALLATLAKQIDVTQAQLVRFERLLKLCGKKLSTVTDNLITYLEASQQQHNASKVLRETKLIPRLVLEAEQFSKRVILLASKANLNWQQYLSLGTARDFRIKAPVLEEVLNTREQPDETRNEVGDEINDADTEIIPTAASERDSDPEACDEDTSRRKRRRVS